VTPLVDSPGKLMLTDQYLYFQPFNNVTTVPVHRCALVDVERVYCRRFTMRDVGLELFFADRA
jgi:factor associated with neutral sphingomyelinase activation